MGARFHSLWQKTRKPISVIGFIVVCISVVVLIIVEVIVNGAGFKGKTLWDWLQLLIIPAVLVVAGYIINLTISRGEQAATEQRAQSEREAAEKRAKAERDIAEDNQREAAMQEYINKMSELLLHENLSKPESGEEVRKIARVRTFTMLTRLDEDRKAEVLLFLYESSLLDANEPIIELNRADLKKIGMSSAILPKVNLSEANLWLASLRFADLSEANLSEVDLEGANLEGAKVTSPLELEKAKSLKGATMPDGTIHP